MEPILIVRSLTYECQYIMDSVPTTSKPHNSVRAVLFLRYVLSRQLWVPETPLKCTSSNNHKYWCYYSNSFTSDSTIYVPYFCSIQNTWLKHTLWNRLFSEDIMEMKKKKVYGCLRASRTFDRKWKKKQCLRVYSIIIWVIRTIYITYCLYFSTVFILKISHWRFALVMFALVKLKWKLWFAYKCVWVRFYFSFKHKN